MPLRSHAPSRPDASADIAVVGVSARSLAAAARRAGLRPLVLDLFADEDTRALAATTVILQRGEGFSLDPKDLMAQLERHVGPDLPLVLGTGFEAMPERVEAIANRFRLMGSGRRTLTWLKQPAAFAQLLADLSIPHPLLFAESAPNGVAALEKQAGAAGGGHVRPARRARGAGWYLQEFVPGRSVSALFLGNGRSARLLGFSEQWCAPTEDAPFRYGGAAGPIRLAPDLEAEIEAALTALTDATGLLGLASTDLVIGETGWWLIEVNPRPGASLDVFDRPPLAPLLRLHLDACEGRLPELKPCNLDIGATVQAAAIFYAPRPVEIGSDLPVWVADRPAPGSLIDQDEPICTVFASGHDLTEARAQLAGRIDHLWHGLNAASRQAAE
ncbi:ATP-grasp domain-containing protein [Ancylobacter radicis]|uniref:ATP-grasp domain-containing protein n=1 Tax=Ancylobacter radicis TaxID=2836179 RepID=A0ABS5RB09_9HYPH|nr:ATP-grasp domain-containing protein [Ancylobacter radicis]MBS9478858.1 ATP-grasp domain-containing protein [Ancylobacter radicis]